MYSCQELKLEELRSTVAQTHGDKPGWQRNPKGSRDVQDTRSDQESPLFPGTRKKDRHQFSSENGPEEAGPLRNVLQSPIMVGMEKRKQMGERVSCYPGFQEITFIASGPLWEQR